MYSILSAPPPGRHHPDLAHDHRRPAALEPDWRHALRPLRLGDDLWPGGFVGADVSRATRRLHDAGNLARPRRIGCPRRLGHAYRLIGFCGALAEARDCRRMHYPAVAGSGSRRSGIESS